MDTDQLMTQVNSRFAISQLNIMQETVIDKWKTTCQDIVLYSPTGSGKTLAFAISILGSINEKEKLLQAIIIVPTRELALQTTDVLKRLTPSIKVTCCYGGHSSQDEKQSLAESPIIVVATPGRILDHINRGNINTNSTRLVVLDEFDKSLELGFVDEMSEVFNHITSSVRLMMTSATPIKIFPEFINTDDILTLNFLDKNDLSPKSRIKTWLVNCYEENRIECLINLLLTLPDERTIIFSNDRSTAKYVFQQLIKHDIPSGLYIGTLMQSEREKALVMFKHGALLVLSASDLGGRGIDINDIKHIIHYEQPLTSEIFTHRNGRTVRTDATGDIYVIKSKEEQLAQFITVDAQYERNNTLEHNKLPQYATVRISAGKKEKVSRGDVVGYLLHNCTMLSSQDISGIEIFDHYTLVTLPRKMATNVIKTISPLKLKKLKVKSMIVDFRPIIKS